MILGNLKNEASYKRLLQRGAFRKAFEWLRALSPDQPDGVFELEGKRIYVNVHGYGTIPRDECLFESHRRYVDLQYCISGGELIDHLPLHRVRERIDYQEDKDLITYPALSGYSTIRMRAGDFAIFQASDIHRPRIHDGTNAGVHKLAIKIDHQLLDAAC